MQNGCVMQQTSVSIAEKNVPKTYQHMMFVKQPIFHPYYNPFSILNWVV